MILSDVTDEIDLLLATIQRIQSAPDLHEALESGLGYLGQIGNWALAEIWLPEGGGDRLVLGLSWQRTPNASLDEFRQQSAGATCRRHEGLVGRVWASGETIWLQDATTVSQERFHRAEFAQKAGIHTALAVPLTSGEGKEVVAVAAFFAEWIKEEAERIVALTSTVATGLGAALQQRQTEEALRESERRYWRLFERMPVGLFRTTEAGQMLDANSALVDLLGYPDLNTLRATPTPLHYVNSDDRNRWRRQLGETGRVRNFEMAIRRQDGEILWVEMSVQAVRGQDGEIFYEGVVQDVTDEREARQALRNREERFRALVQNAQDLIAIMDGQGRFRYVSPSYLQVLGYESDVLLGKDAFAAMHPDDREHAMVAFRAILQTPGSVLSARFRYRDADGAWRSLEALGTNLLHHPVVQGVVVNSRDVTERVRIEEALLENEKRFRTIFEDSPLGVAVISLDLRFEQVNKRLGDILGYSTEALAERSLPELTYPADLGKDREVISQLIAGEIPRYDTEKRFVRQDGQPVWMRMTMTMVRDEDELPLYGLLLLEEIQERKETEARLDRSLQELQRSNEELQHFAYVASHDLQEPLRMVTSYLQLLQRRYQGQLDEDADDFIGFAVDGAERMKRLINDLLTYSRVATKAKPPVPTDTAMVLKEVLADLKLAITRNSAQITYDPLPTVAADSTQIAQLFRNLLENAIKFRGEDPPRIHVGVEAQEKMWKFWVADNGIGFDQSYADRIFVLFQRLTTRAEYEGTGMGLAICEKIVERHGGRIWVKSAPGEGTTFYFTLPRRDL